MLRRKEMQSLINASRKSLAEAEMQIAERNKLLRNEVVENRKMKKTLKEIKKLLEGNNYNRPDIILNKLKELVND